MTIPIDQWRQTLKFGDSGEDVRALQRVLIDAGYDLGRAGADGIFGKFVHNGVVAWQRARGWAGLEVTGQFGTEERQALSIDMAPLPAREPVMDWSLIKYREAKNWSREVGPQPKTLIVLHCMEIIESSTTAERCADYFASQPAGEQSSAHACVDDDSIVQCVPWDRIAWHAPGANRNGVGIEHAGFARQTSAQWLDQYGVRMLKISTWLCAQLCMKFSIPIRVVDVAELQELGGKATGVTTHAMVSEAFGKSTHTDPGTAFPLAYYMALTKRWRDG